MSRPSSTKTRRQCFDHWKYTDVVTGRIMLQCHICNLPIDPTREKWEAEHVIRRSVGGADDPENVRPAHVACHAPKTAVDVAENAKGKRVADRHYGIKQSRGFYRPKGAKFNWATGRYEKRSP